MKWLRLFIMFFVIGFVVFLVYFAYLRKEKVLADTESERIEKCELLLNRFNGRMVGCDYELLITPDIIKRVVRVGNIEKFGNSFFANIIQLRNGRWQKEKIYIGDKDSGILIGLKRAKEFLVDADGPEVENDVVGVSEMVDLFNENVNREIVVFLKKENVIFLKQSRYRLITLMLYP